MYKLSSLHPAFRSSDAPIRARVLAFFVEHQPSQSSAGQAMRTGGTGQARGVGIRSRRQFFHGRWLANHSYNRCRWSASTAEAVLARACFMCLDYLLPSVHPSPTRTMVAQVEARWMASLALPACYGPYPHSAREKSEKEAKGAVCALQVLGLWRGGGVGGLQSR
jgi:hypothetical protein